MTWTPIIIESIVLQHADEAATLFSRRRFASRSPEYIRSELTALDDRLEAHIDALRIAGDAGRAVVAGAIAGPPGLFVAAVVAIERRDAALLAIVQAACAAAPAAAAIGAALAWTRGPGTGVAPAPAAKPANAPPAKPAAPFPASAEALARTWLADPAPMLRLAGLTALALLRRDPGPALVAGLNDASPDLAARAAKMAAELGRADLATPLRKVAARPEPQCAFWGNVALAILIGDPGAAAALMAVAESPDPRAPLAATIAARKLRGPEALAMIRRLAAKPPLAVAACAAAASAGTAAAISAVLPLLANPATSPVAAEAVAAVAGIRLSEHKLARIPASGDELHDTGADVPDPAAVARWWKDHEPEFQNPAGHFGGKPVDAAALSAVIDADTLQSRRETAALLLAMLQPARGIAPTRRRATAP